MMDLDMEDLTFTVETDDEDTEIALVVRSTSGRKITQHEFVMQVEQYLNEVAHAEIYRRQTNALDH